MSITIRLDLPDALLTEAKAKGLLDSARIGDLLAAELRRQKAAADLNNVLGKVRAQSGEPATDQDIVAEVKGVRK